MIGLCMLAAVCNLFPVDASAFDEVVFCTTMKDFAEKAKADEGTMLDEFTRFDGMAVLCGVRMITFYKFIKVAPEAMRDGWNDRKQALWNEMFCKDAAWLSAIQAGWRVSQTVTFVDGAPFYNEARC
jgi:hypothetical protein